MQYLKANKDKFLRELSLNITLPLIVNEIVQDIWIQDGELYLVGGGVIDLLCEENPKDWDIEVFNMSYEELLKVLQRFGSPNLIGNKFGIIKLKVEGIDLEFSIPRIESRTGLKHKDFDITLVPGLTIEEAAKRRDFTVNAIYFDLYEGVLIDPFSGLEDLKKGQLNCVNEDTFKEDPLRVFRGVQILSRKLQYNSINLYLLVDSMVRNKELDNLTGESIFGELNKMFLKGTYFKSAANFMEVTGILDWLGLRFLAECPQNPDHHPEGNAWEHTILVMEEAFRYRDELPEEWRLPFMYGMLLHDIGKLSVLNTETLQTHGHESAGVPIARKFMERLTNSEDFIKKVLTIVETHMRPRFLKVENHKAWRKLQNKCPLNILAYVSMVDEDGRKLPKQGKNSQSFKNTMEVFNKLGEPSGEIKPILMGRHLIENGHKPGPEFGKVLKRAYEYQIETGCENLERLYLVGQNFKTISVE